MVKSEVTGRCTSFDTCLAHVAIIFFSRKWSLSPFLMHRIYCPASVFENGIVQCIHSVYSPHLIPSSFFKEWTNNRWKIHSHWDCTRPYSLSSKLPPLLFWSSGILCTFSYSPWPILPCITSVYSFLFYISLYTLCEQKLCFNLCGTHWKLCLALE